LIHTTEGNKKRFVFLIARIRKIMDETAFQPAKLDRETETKLGRYKLSFQDHREAHDLAARIIRDVMSSIESKSGQDYRDFKELMEMGVSYKDSILQIVKEKVDILTEWTNKMDEVKNRDEALGLVVRYYLGASIKNFRRQL
jgi:hypothetical protein